MKYTGSRFNEFGYNEHPATIHCVPLTTSSVTTSTRLQGAVYFASFYSMKAGPSVIFFNPERGVLYSRQISCRNMQEITSCGLEMVLSLKIWPWPSCLQSSKAGPKSQNSGVCTTSSRLQRALAYNELLHTTNSRLQRTLAYNELSHTTSSHLQQAVTYNRHLLTMSSCLTSSCLQWDITYNKP